jgi:glycerophosphoryl diester phosphodiesterase
MSYFESSRPRLFAHRGASGSFPENTMIAFRAGVDQGATHLELDVHATRDGQIVVLHDPDLDRTTDATGPVRGLDFAALARVDAGYGFRDSSGSRRFAGQRIRIPPLDEVLRAFPDTPLNIEIKQDDPPIEAEVIGLLRRHSATARVLLAAEAQPIMQRIRPEYDGPTGFTAEEALEFYQRAVAGHWEGYRAPGRALQVPPIHQEVEVVTPALLAAAHRLGIEVHVWTINDEESARRLVALGVDGIMSDFPSRIAGVLARA